MDQQEKGQSYRNIIRVPADTRQRFLQLEQEASVPLTRLGVRLSGIGTFGLDYQVGYREPACHLVILTLKGTGFYDSSEHPFRPSEGDLLVSPAGVPMLLGTIDQSWTFLWFYIHPLKRWQHLDGTHPWMSRPSFATQLNHCLEGLIAETGYTRTQSVLSEAGWSHGEPGPIMPSSRTANLFGELIAEYLRKILSSPLQKNDPRELALQELWKAIEQSPGLDWSQACICKRLDFSPATLQRLVRRLYDSSPLDMVVAIRMQRARALLIQSDYPLSVIAREVGYSDAFVFSAAFKRFHAQSPSEFKQAELKD